MDVKRKRWESNRNAAWHLPGVTEEQNRNSGLFHLLFYEKRCKNRRRVDSVAATNWVASSSNILLKSG